MQTGEDIKNNAHKEAQNRKTANVSFVLGMHLPFVLKEFSFYQIGNDDRYFSDQAGFFQVQQVSRKSYQPALTLIEKLLTEHNLGFVMALAPSGTLLDQLQLYVPEVLNTLRRLVLLHPGKIEVCASPYFNALFNPNQPDAWERQILQMMQRIKVLFGLNTKTYIPTGLLYNPTQLKFLSQLGFTKIMVEGCAISQSANFEPNTKLQSDLATDNVIPFLPRHTSLSDDIWVRFSDENWDGAPLTAEKYVSWLENEAENNPEIVIHFDLRALGDINTTANGIFFFFEKLIRLIAESPLLNFALPGQLHGLCVDPNSGYKHNPNVGLQGKELNNWVGNHLQADVLQQMATLDYKVLETDNAALCNVWGRLHDAEYLAHMATDTLFKSGPMVMDGPGLNAYDTYIGFMNILKDLSGRLL